MKFLSNSSISYLRSHYFIIGIFLLAMFAVSIMFINLAYSRNNSDARGKTSMAIDNSSGRGLADVSRDTLVALKNKDVEAIAPLIDAAELIYVGNLGEVSNQRSASFSSAQFAALFSTKRNYNWGTYPATGMKMTLSADVYWQKYLWTEDFTQIAPEFESFENFPRLAAQFGEFDVQTVSYSGQKGNLLLAFFAKDGKWYLKAIVGG